MKHTKYAVGFSVAAVLGVCTMVPASAAPVLSNAAALKSAVENPISEVRYVRRGVARRVWRGLRWGDRRGPCGCRV